jgi:hypothetical protein
MSLSSLPAELQLNIVEHLDPDSNLQFALTCKENATLCGSVLEEHGFRLSEWQVIDTTNGKTLLWEKLKEFIQYPSLGWYIRELNLPSDRQYSWNPAENHAGDGPSNRDKELFARAARQLQNLYPLLEKVHHQDHNYLADSITNPDDLIGTIQERIDGCYEDGVIAILLHYLPNLQTIRITDIKTYALELMLYRIACAYKSPEKSRHLPLKHLKTVSIAHWDSELSCSPDWACYFSSIPTVKTIAAYAMGNSPWDVVAKQLCSQPLSNVTELFLFQCQMDVEGLATILKGIKNLIKFTYTAGGSTVSDMSYDPKRVIKALLEHAAHSLEELVLDQEDFAEDVSLPPFFSAPQHTHKMSLDERRNRPIHHFPPWLPKAKTTKLPMENPSPHRRRKHGV